MTEFIEKKKIIDFIKNSKIPRTRGVTEHGKGFRGGVNTTLKVLELMILGEKP